MAHLVRPLIQHLPRWRHRHTPSFSLLRGYPSPELPSLSYLSLFSFSARGVHLRSRALRSLRSPPPADVSASDGDDSDSDRSGGRRSRNERKREARRAVQWGMDLATFSPSQIKRILRVAALEQEVFDAIMLVKRLGRDVREGKRRQFNYIGRLLREAEPELMDSLIQATKDGDTGKFLGLSGVETLATHEEEDEVVVKEEELEEENEEEDSSDISVATRWFDGLVNKNISITNEVYSLREVEFDRQELRQLVRKVHSSMDSETSSEENGKSDGTTKNARISLTRFLRCLAKQLPS